MVGVVSEPTRRMELPLADALGRVGPTMSINLGDRRFAGAPICWQDWTLWQHVAIEEHYGSVSQFQRMWLGLGDDPSEDDDPHEQAQSLMEKARAINEGEPAKQKSGREATQASPLNALGMPDCPVGIEDQAFYAWVLLGAYEVDEHGNHVLSEEARLRGPDAWTISLEWVMAHATPVTLKLILARVLLAQWEASAGELEGEAEEGEHPKEDSSSAKSAGDGSSGGSSESRG